MGASGYSDACWMSASTTSSVSAAITRTWSRIYMRPRVATWSLRERPARSFPPRVGPAMSRRPRSRAECTSSSLTCGVNSPVSTRRPSSSSAASMSRSSLSPKSPARARTRACAFEPRTSYGARRQSKSVDLDRAAMTSAGPEAKRPPHRATRSTDSSGASVRLCASCVSLTSLTPR